MEDLLSSLNPVQRQAVLTTQGPLLILAGAGTGKTKTITTRMAYILRKGLADISEILAVTFTNKAATELKERVSKATGIDVTGFNPRFWIGTFHSIALKMLREYYYVSGVELKTGFTIADTSDSESVLKDVLLEHSAISASAADSEEVASTVESLEKQFAPIKQIRDSISKLKNRGLEPDDLIKPQDQYLGKLNLKPIYLAYQERLKRSNRVDFDDILLYCVKIFKQNPTALKKYQQQFKYILVDEYQDTNDLQNTWLRYLSNGYRNICCVGDDDQSIYSWRGANVSHILNFQQQYSDAQIFTLEQNYRSTQPILKVATRVIGNNIERHAKTLWCERNSEDNVKLHECINNYTEAELIAEEIVRYRREGYDYRDMAILVRAGYQSRILENQLRTANIPYNLIGGVKFYERAEIKDAISYMSLLANMDDDIAFKRVINSPRRGVGSQTLKQIASLAQEENLSLFKATASMLRSGAFKGKSKEKVLEFVSSIYYGALLNNLHDDEAFSWVASTSRASISESSYTSLLKEATEQGLSLFEAGLRIIEEEGLLEVCADSAAPTDTTDETKKLGNFITKLREVSQAAKSNLCEIVETVLEGSGYLPDLRAQRSVAVGSKNESTIAEKLANLNELLNELSTYENIHDYLEHVTLNIAVDLDVDKREDRVAIMTLHAAKGLEFEIVFLSGWVQGIFPSNMVLASSHLEDKLCEERRLAYVGLTRAKTYLHVLYPLKALNFGKWEEKIPSMFVKELQGDCVEFIRQANAADFLQEDQRRSYSRGMVLGRRVQVSRSSISSPTEVLNEVSAIKKGPRDSKIAAGDKVFHPEFGVGVVDSLYANLLKVKFESKAGLITLVPSVVTKLK